MAIESDFPTTPWPMRVDIASDGDFLTLDKEDIKERQAAEVGRLGGRGSWCWLVRLVLGHRRLIFSLVLVHWCVAGWRAWSLVLGAA